MIVGTLLGDGRLEERSKGIRAYTARLRIHHDEVQKEYVLWKYHVLKEYVTRGPREIVWINPRRQLREVSWYFHTRSTTEFRTLYDCFYRSAKKVVPHEIERLLTARAIAVWAMDDGTYSKPGFIFNTHTFEVDDQNRLRDALEKKFGIASLLHRDRSYWKIAIDGRSAVKLFTVINTFIIPTMRYKIGVPVSTDPERVRVIST